MIQIHPASVGYPSTGKNGTGLVHSNSVPPFSWETVSLSVLRLANFSPVNQLTSVSDLSPHVIEAVRQLIEIIKTLRATALLPSESPLGGHFSLSFTPENLLPYVSEEAYEVLEALPGRAEGQGAGGRGQGAGVDTKISPSPLTPHPSPLTPSPLTPHPLTSFQALTPYLLWSVARSSYLIMQLIEGVSVQQYQADGTWLPGMVRLVVMLVVKAPTTDWCFDLATGCPPTSLLDQSVVLRSDENWLPIWRSPTPTASHPGDLVEHQLQALSSQIQATVPAIKPFLDGESVELLLPGGDWQPGEIQLKFGFEFMEWESDFTSYPSLGVQSDLVEAELLEDEAISELCSRVFTPIAPVSQVSVMELPYQSMGAATLVRLTAPKTLEWYRQAISQQQILEAIAHLGQNPNSTDTNAQLLQVLSKAYEIVQRTDHASDRRIYLQQPVLLMQELMPKLLWQLTCSSYEVMQLISGIEASILLPGSPWQQGTLRLLTVLWFKAPGVDFALDLATGRSIKPESVFLPAETVCQIWAPSPKSASAKAILAQPLSRVETLVFAIQQEIPATTPEIQLLMGETQVEWLEDGQDWQQGTLQLKLGLEFIV